MPLVHQHEDSDVLHSTTSEMHSDRLHVGPSTCGLIKKVVPGMMSHGKTSLLFHALQGMLAYGTVQTVHRLTVQTRGGARRGHGRAYDAGTLKFPAIYYLLLLSVYRSHPGRRHAGACLQRRHTCTRAAARSCGEGTVGHKQHY